MQTATVPTFANSSNHLYISAPRQNDTSLSIKVSSDLPSSNIIIDVTSPDNRNIIVRLLNSEKKIIKTYSWYLMRGRNITSIKNYDQLESGLYKLQIMKIGGDIIFSSQLTLSPVRIYPLLRLHL